MADTGVLQKGKERVCDTPDEIRVFPRRDRGAVGLSGRDWVRR